MSTGKKIPIKKARSIAEKVVEKWRPICSRIEIAGSIRRGRPWVSDIDLVLELEDAHRETILAACKAGVHVVRSGPELATLRTPSGIQVDLYFARPETADLLDRRPSNFGSVFYCRTGSAAHNIRTVERAKELGLTWSPHRGVLGASGQVIASATEAEIFKALEWDFRPPEAREK